MSPHLASVMSFPGEDIIGSENRFCSGAGEMTKFLSAHTAHAEEPSLIPSIHGGGRIQHPLLASGRLHLLYISTFRQM